MVAKNKRMSSFPLPGQSLNVMAQIEARKQMQHQRSSSSSSTVHHRNNNNNNNTLIHMATSNDDSFTSLITNNNNNNTRRLQQQQTTTTDFTTFSTTELKSSISSDNEFDIDHQIIMTDSSTSTFTGLLNSFNAAADAAAAVEEEDDGNGVEDDKDVQFAMNYFAQEMVVHDDHHHATTVNNTPSPPIIATTATAEGEIMKQYTTEHGEEIVFQSMLGVQPTSLSRRNDVNNDDDHRDDDIYDTEDEYTASESANEDEEEEDDDYPTEAEEETSIGEFTEGEDDDDDDDESSVGSVGSVGSYNTLLEQMENDDTTIREVVIDATSMDKETAEDMAQQLQKCTSISTIRLSCRRLEHKEGRTRKHHVLTTLLSGITENTSIESIEIEDTDISHPLAHSLSQMCARKQSLKNIAMIQCQFIGSGLAILFLGMQHSQSIRNVIFQSCDLGNTHNNNGGGGSTTARQPSSYNVEIIASALPLMNLTSLSLVDVNFPTEECLHYLIENIEYAKELKLLDLSQNKLDVRSVVQLSKSMNRQNQISRLVLSSCSLDNVCMKELAVGLRGYDPLTNLDISRNRHVGDRTAVLVKDLLKGNSKITKLNVKGCSFSEVSLDALEAALRYNNSFLKTFVSVSTGQQIFDVVDALANLGVGGDEDEEDEEEWRVSDGGGGGGGSRKHHGGDDRRRHHARDVAGKQQFRTTPKKSNKSSSTSPMVVDRDRGDFVGNSISPRRDEMLSLFNTSVDKRNGNVVSTPQQRDAKVHPSLHGQKVPRSPPPPPPPPPPQVPRQDIPQGTQDSTSARRNVNVPMAQFFEDQVSIDRMSSSHSVQSGTKFASPQRTNGNVPTPQFTSTNEFFPSGSGQEPPGLQYSPRKSSKSPVSTPQYELRTTSSSQSGTSKPTRQGIISAKYGSQRKSAGQKSPKIDKVIAQLSPSKRDTVRSPRSPRSPGGSLSGRRIML